jgi:ABC-2 type transport system permease protein
MAAVCLVRDLKSNVRQRDQLFFTLLFPILMLAIFAVAFGEQEIGPPGAEVGMATYYLPGMLSAGIMMVGAQGLGLDIAQDKADGTLKRLGATPLRPSAYLAGKIAAMIILGAAQAVLVLAVGAALGAELPSAPAAWARLAWVILLGLAACSLIGIGLSAVPRTGKSATAVIIPIILVLCFTSGVYLPYSQLPGWLQDAAALFPLKWLGQGARSALLPDAFAALEPAHAWQPGLVALALAGWLVLGGLWAKATFRWTKAL